MHLNIYIYIFGILCWPSMATYVVLNRNRSTHNMFCCWTLFCCCLQQQFFMLIYLEILTEQSDSPSFHTVWNWFRRHLDYTEGVIVKFRPWLSQSCGLSNNRLLPRTHHFLRYRNITITVASPFKRVNCFQFPLSNTKCLSRSSSSKLTSN